MYVWRHIPLLKFLLPFIIGIVSADYIPISLGYLALLIATLVASAIGLHFYLLKNINLRIHMVSSLFIVALFWCIGLVSMRVHDPFSYKSHFTAYDDGEYITARLCSQPSEKEKSYGCKLEVLKVKDSLDVWHTVTGKVQVYFAKDSLAALLSYGDIIVLRNSLKRTESPVNRHQFDFKKYYGHKGIFYNGFLKSGSWISTGGSEKNFLYALGYSWQQGLKGAFNRHFKNKATKGVAQAIVFGYKDDLDAEWLDAFSKTGTIHVLAVSGLHVGIIYILLSTLLMVRRSKGRALVIKSGILILALFFYSLLTGFAPSVSRASIMFGLVIAAKALDRNSNIYNTLAFACFVLLLVDPHNIYNVGFQFSFLAVLGIVYYKDFFRSWWPQSSVFGDKVVSLMAVSLAAQLATFPLGLYYFHQYPNFFMISNLIVIPCITMILYFGIAFVAVAFWSDLLASWLAYVVSAYIDFIAVVVSYIQDIPYAFFEGVHITFVQMLCIYAFILTVTAALVHKWKAGFTLAIACIMLFLFADFRYERSLISEEWISFEVANETLIGLKQDKKLFLLCTEKVYTDQKKLEFIILPFIVNERLDPDYTVSPLSLSKSKLQYGDAHYLGNGIIRWRGRSILLLDNMTDYLEKPIAVDVLVIGSKKSERFITKVTPMIARSKTVVLKSWKSNNLNRLMLKR
jgi:competence protein ComEC